MREITDNDRPDIVLCGKAETITWPGSHSYKCSKCGEACACSSYGHKMIEQGAKPYCFKCGLALANSDIKADFVYSGQSLKAAIKFINDLDKN